MNQITIHACGTVSIAHLRKGVRYSVTVTPEIRVGGHLYLKNNEEGCFQRINRESNAFQNRVYRFEVLPCRGGELVFCVHDLRGAVLCTVERRDI